MKALMLFASLYVLLPSDACASTTRYTTEPGFDRPGPAYESFVQTSDYQSHELCRDACESQPRCRSYTYFMPGVKGERAVCALKDSVPAPVEDACCVSAVKGGKPSRPAVPSLRLEWLGWDGDRVGKTAQQPTSDGAIDHHLRLALRLAKATDVVAIELRRHGENATRWSTRDAAAEYLAAELDGRRLNPGRTPTLGKHAGEVVFDLYAHDIGQWDVHRTVVADVLLADGRRITHEFTLVAPPDRLLGLWEMHCQSSAPGAFEPMSIDGRLNFVLRPDGAIAGHFGALPLSGRIDAKGKLEGSAEDASANVELQGEIEKHARGKPVRGRGSFRFVRALGGCAGTGTWSGH